jgi:hypothetical protein
MWMLVIIVLMVVTMTQLVFRTIAASFYGMHQVMVAKKNQGSEDVRLVNRNNSALQFCQALWLH